jgi:hypothetical protein
MSMSKEVLLMLHPAFGVLAMFAGVWVFVEVLNAGPGNVNRIRNASLILAVLMWLSFILGGYWYVAFYAADRAIIKAGPWPFAHELFMENKEHLFFTLLLLSTYLPIAASRQLAADKGERNLVLVVCALIVALGLVMEGSGALVGIGAKVALLAR